MRASNNWWQSDPVAGKQPFDPDAYLQEGTATKPFDPDEYLGKRAVSSVTSASTSSTPLDLAKSAGVGLAKGAIGLAGMPGDLTERGAQGIDKAVTAVGNLFGKDWRRSTVMPNAAPLGESHVGAGAIQHGVENVTGPFYKPQTTAGEYANALLAYQPDSKRRPVRFGALAGTSGTRPN